MLKAKTHGLKIIAGISKRKGQVDQHCRSLKGCAQMGFPQEDGRQMFTEERDGQQA